MPVNLTPSNIFPTNFRAPDDGDPANGATFQQCFQDAADASTHLKEKVDIKEPVGLSARYLFPSGVVTDDPIKLTETFADAGYTLTSDTDIKVPVAGKYLVSMSALLFSSNDSAHVNLSLVLKLNGVEVGRANGRRFSTDDSEPTPAQATFAIYVANADHALTVSVETTGTPGVSSLSPRYMSIVCLSKN